MKQVTDSTFEQEVLNSDKPVLVDFSAVWCGPCKMLEPTVRAIADEYAGRVHVYKLDIDQSPLTPARYGVRGVPTLILFKDGQERDRIIGVTSKDTIEQMIDDNL
ncbi:MAG: thioredoxin [Acidobacteriota bacterium]|nr:thioredoxin [Blastocatellia bacterium]MDW8241491.1 thioredoxin [Acidobacteriota bacterium]